MGATHRGPIRRMSSEDYFVGPEFLKLAFLVSAPDLLSQKKFFRTLMPQVYVYRRQGRHWKEITWLVNEAGVALKQVTVSTYYREMLQEEMELCQEAWREFSEQQARPDAQQRAQDALRRENLRLLADRLRQTKPDLT